MTKISRRGGPTRRTHSMASDAFYPARCTGWCIKDPEGHLIPSSFRRTRRDVLYARFNYGGAALLPLTDWTRRQRRGWAIIRVEVEEAS